MESRDLDSLLSHFKSKIDAIWELLPFVQICNRSLLNGHNKDYVLAKCRENDGSFSHLSDECCDDSELSLRLPDLFAISDMIYEMKDMLNEIRVELLQQTDAIKIQRERCIERTNHLKEHLDYLKQNIPEFFMKRSAVDQKQQKQVVAISKAKPKAETTVASKNGKKSVKQTKPLNMATNAEKSFPKLKTAEKNKQPIESKFVKKAGNEGIYKNWPNIEFITVDDFESIPQYMKGRVTYEMINGAVSEFNQAIAEKYKLMSTHPSKYTEEEFKKYQLFKSQENGETVGQFFCLLQDFKQFSTIKAENTVKIILTCLRHCKRIKEIRGPGKIIRYAIVCGDNH